MPSAKHEFMATWKGAEFNFGNHVAINITSKSPQDHHTIKRCAASRPPTSICGPASATAAVFEAGLSMSSAAPSLPLPRFLGAVALAAAVVCILLRRRRRRWDPRSPLCGRPEWTMTRALRRGASYAQSAVMGSLAAPMTTQVGGHMPSAGSGAGMLAVGDRDRKGLGGLGGVVLKPVQSGERGAREVSFYEAMGAPGALWRGRPVGAATRAEFAGLRRFLCGYHGVVALGEADGTERRYIVLDDCTAGMARPCARDVGAGRG